MRIVKDFSEIKELPAFINSVAMNPVAAEINTTRTNITQFDSNYTSEQRNINNYASALDEAKRKLMIYETERTRLKRKLETLEKIASKTANTDLLSKYNATKFDQFLRPLGLRFFAMQSQGTSNESIYFWFTRETKKINYLTTPPLMLRIRYAFSRDYGTYYLAEAKAMPLIIFGTDASNYVHPHINSGSDSFKGICMGNYFDVLKNNKIPLTFSNWQDHCLLLDQLLSTYNPDSPYIRLDEIARILKQHGYTINDYDNSGNYIHMDTNSRFTLLADGLEQMNKYKPENILTKGMFDRFEATIKEMNIDSLISDAIAALTMTYFSDEVDSYSALHNFVNGLGVDISGVDIDSIESVRDYNEDSDDYYITEETFEELKTTWIDLLKNSLGKKKSYDIPLMTRERYKYYFGEEAEPVKEESTEPKTEEVATTEATILE